jgi:glycosyltransferase involved in cell wall biosynthesis
LLSVVIPVKDEEDAIIPCLTRLEPILSTACNSAGGCRDWEIIFVDDGSRDSTFKILTSVHRANSRVKAVSLSRNFGKEAALSAGLDYASGDAIIPMDVDLQDPPEIIGEMFRLWREGVDVVYGVRRNRRSDSLSKRLTADLYYRAHNWLSADKIPEHAGDFRLLDRKVAEVIRAMPERNRFMKGIYAWAGFRQASVEYDRVERTVGKTKFKYWRLWTLALDGITSASTVPLRVWSYIGGIIAIAAFLYAAFIGIRTIVFGVDVPGYASLMVAILFFGGLQLLSLGILGEYVGRIMTEVKGRPLYVVQASLGLNSDPHTEIEAL